MTTLAVLSDIHGNLPALAAVLEDLRPFKVDHVVVAGDVINWGPFSAQVMERVVQEGWAVIRGNNEYYLLDYGTPRAPAAWQDTSQFPIPRWLHQQLDGRWRTVIAAWPDTLSLRFPDAPPIRVVHGSPRSNTEPIFPAHRDEEIEQMLSGVEETVIIAAHSHLRLERRVGRWHILNAGTVGVPLDGVRVATYMLLEGDERGWRPRWRAAPFDPGPLFQEFARQRFVEQCGVVGQLIIEEFRTARLHLHPFVHWRLACCPAEPITPALLERYTRVNPWDYTPLAYHLNL
ncbi:MAG: metallophosphoesterase family protein [Chloroflexota bacterium]